MLKKKKLGKIRKARNKYQKTPGNSVFQYQVNYITGLPYYAIFAQIVKLDTSSGVRQQKWYYNNVFLA